MGWLRTDLWIIGDFTLLRLVFDTAALRFQQRSATVLKASRSNVKQTIA